MTWPFENDTSSITSKLARKSLKSEKRRNLMVVIAVALAAFLICFTGIVSTSLTQMPVSYTHLKWFRSRARVRNFPLCCLQNESKQARCFYYE